MLKAQLAVAMMAMAVLGIVCSALSDPTLVPYRSSTLVDHHQLSGNETMLAQSEMTLTHSE